ncbi:MAG: Type secretion system rane protein PorP/SprF [Bacteroidota bacterium]|jgi:type IX secretion system PorP/SprF family membrane protein
MSNLSYSNIDRWLFELVEGNLSPEQIAQLEAFLLQHPELDVDKDMWDLTKVESHDYVYPHQQKFIKRRPVGVYMSLGFASIAVVISLGFFNFYSSQLFGIEMNKQIVASTFDADKSSHNAFSVENKISKSDALMSYSEEGNNPFVSQNQNFKTVFTGNEFRIQKSIKNDLTDRTLESNTTRINQIANYEVQKMNNELKEKEIGLASFETEKAKEIPYTSSNEEFVSKTFSSQNNVRFAKSDYKMSFGAKLNKMGRSIQRMMDNPVALKNTKDPYYHVPGMQAMDVNFGAVGTLLATRVQTVSRAQWLGENNQQLMNQISVDGYSYGMRGGLGFQLNQNYYGKGEIVNYNASLIYSPKFSIARNVVLEPSIRFKMGNKAINTELIQTGTMVEYDRMNQQEFYGNGSVPMGEKLWYKDLGLGLMVNTKWFYVGVQQDNLLRHYDNIYSSDIANPRRIGKHFIATIGTDYESKKENITVSPYAVYQQKEALSEGWLGVNVKYHWLTLGGAISSNLEPAASIGLKFNYFMIAYNADYTYSQNLNGAQLSHQLTLRFSSKPSRIGQRLLNQ